MRIFRWQSIVDYLKGFLWENKGKKKKNFFLVLT